jgi:protein TilB
MPRITQEMILKKSEHHTGLLADLQEISLHQLHIERIELLGQVCRRLRILYLQNNLIPRLENLNKLKDLRYLNVALNNITRIENIDGCEKLERLDLTVNYVDIDALPDSVACLARLDFFHDLYLTGNPCTDFSDYRAFVVASLPRLSRLDGKDVTKTERLLAEQNMPLIRAHLAEAAAERVAARNAAEEKAALLERVRARAARRAGRASRRAAAAKAAATAAKAAAREPARLEEIPTATATTEDDDEEEESAAQQPQGPEDDAVADAAGAAADGPVSDDSDSDGDGLSCVDITALEKEVERAGWKYSPANRREMYLSELEEQRKREEEKQKPNERFAPAPDLVKEAYAKLNTKATEGPNGERPTQRNPARIPFSIKVRPTHTQLLYTLLFFLLLLLISHTARPSLHAHPL